MPRPKAQGGRPSKGDRDALYLRPPREIGDRIRAEAERLDVTYSDYLTWVAAEHLGMQFVPPLLSPTDQQELPLKTA